MRPDIRTPRAVQASIEINRPIQEVFECVIDLEHAPQWQAEFVGVKDLSDTKIGVGATMTVVLRFLGRRVENTMQVAALEPPLRFSLVTLSGYLPADFDFDLAPVRGGTRVTYSGDWELPRGMLFRLLKPAKPVLDRLDQRQWQSNLVKLKRLLEA